MQGDSDIPARQYGLRPKKACSLLDYFKKIDEEIGYESSCDSSERRVRRKKKVKDEDTDFMDTNVKKKRVHSSDTEYSVSSTTSHEEKEYDRLPKSKLHIKLLLKKVKERIKYYKTQFFKEQHEMQNSLSKVHPKAIPISADIRHFDF